MISVAIVDTIGLVYDGSTLSKRGLGGSESAVILMSHELSRLGFDVTVYNNCEDSQASPGEYDGVKYKPFRECEGSYHDVVISSRTVLPFCPEHYFRNFTNTPEKYSTFESLHRAKLKILWLHDTFCVGDQLIEELVLSGHIDELFTLSDFHTSYIANCDHGGQKRNFEVLKRKIFMTRNGAVNHIPWVDIKAKDPNLFVYNASVTKGMIPLVTRIWPELKRRIPEGKLVVIGGFYRFRDGAPPDKQEEDWHKLRAEYEAKGLDIHFTGVIPQPEIASILARASYFLYPCAFPETFGISMLESMLYNTPMVTCRFGATEETAIEQANYLIDYPIAPNSLFPHVNQDQQIARFIEVAHGAYQDKYLHQQKMYACNAVKDVSGWDTIARQWEQHIFKKLGLYMSSEAYRVVKRINDRVHRLYNRRFSNPEEWRVDKMIEQRITVVTPFYNAQDYIEKCMTSVISQDYDNWRMILIDDASTDSGGDRAVKFRESLPGYLRDRIEIRRNSQNVGAVRNQVGTIRALDSSDVVMLLDGDDALVNDPHIFDMYNNMFHGSVQFSYGSCWSMVDNIPLIAQPYPPEVKANKTYRQHKFNWGMPYTHLRVFRKYLIDKVEDTAFQDEKGEWVRAGGDNATFYNILEQADPSSVYACPDVVYLYNDKNPINDYKVNGEEQTKNMEFVVNGGLTLKVTDPGKTKKILIAIPTSRYIEPETFKSIYDLDVPDGYETDFQFFYGYNVDQVRNLIAHWAIRYDYLLAVDSDIVVPKDALRKMLGHDKDVITGMYIQRIPGTHALEIYGFGGRVPYDLIRGQGLVEIDGCGFGCVLVKSEVFKTVGYPQFVYHSAIDHKDTISEDTYFCKKAKEKGFRIWVDTSIKCPHKGSTWFNVDEDQKYTDQQLHFKYIAENNSFPVGHVQYLEKMKSEGANPAVVYDIGACVLHWYDEAIRVWPSAQYFVMDAMDETEFMYKERKLPYHCGVLTDKDNRILDFYQNLQFPGGNSYYRENSEVNPEAAKFFNESSIVKKIGMRLDTIASKKSWPKPDMLKIDVQGAELDILKGGEETLKSVKDIIIELQHTEYNKGAPNADQVIAYLNDRGFELVAQFAKTPYDGDYHFRRVRE